MKALLHSAAALACLGSVARADPATECGGASQVEIGAGFAMDAARALDEITERTLALPALEASQSAWSAYRDAHCDYVGATFGGGSGTGIGIDSCRIELGRARAADLLRYVQ